MYKAIEYNSKEEVLAAYRKMIERKRKWIEETEQELANRTRTCSVKGREHLIILITMKALNLNRLNLHAPNNFVQF